MLPLPTERGSGKISEGRIMGKAGLILHPGIGPAAVLQTTGTTFESDE